MRESMREFAALISKTLPIEEPIYEFGAMQVPGYEGFADLRPFFSGKQYVGCDMREGPGVDKVLNLHNIDLPNDTAGTVICFDTLEHVEYPHKAMEEVFRITKPGGMVIISSVMNFAIHEHPYDYWRFTPEAFKSLLKPFDTVFVDYAGDEIFPHTVVGVAFKGSGTPTDEFLLGYETWKKEWFNVERMSAWKKLRRQITPPVLQGFKLKRLFKK